MIGSSIFNDLTAKLHKLFTKADKKKKNERTINKTIHESHNSCQNSFNSSSLHIQNYNPIWNSQIIKFIQSIQNLVSPREDGHRFRFRFR